MNSSLNIYACVHAWAPPLNQRLRWVAQSHVAQQLRAAATDRHSSTLIIWPVTIHTHRCTVLREKTEHKLGLLVAGGKAIVETHTLMKTFKNSVTTFRQTSATSSSVPVRSACSLNKLTSLRIFPVNFFFFSQSNTYFTYSPTLIIF